MKRVKRYRSTLLRMEEILSITRERYEPGNQSRCYRAVWRRYIEPRFGICYRTYLAYVKWRPGADEEREENERQLKLFEDE
ncbi:MAG: hypothetical protein LBP56_07555 [Odoribacteraceae bacterium]|jgi:hypothetical protein|nr:hypothetical protein [Odoribacteraceae bacterium]